MRRRDALRTMACGGAGLTLWPRISFGQVGQRGRFVFVLLRGGFDGRVYNAIQKKIFIPFMLQQATGLHLSVYLNQAKLLQYLKAADDQLGIADLQPVCECSGRTD